MRLERLNPSTYIIRREIAKKLKEERTSQDPPLDLNEKNNFINPKHN